jgi:hypothetical protein
MTGNKQVDSLLASNYWILPPALNIPTLKLCPLFSSSLFGRFCCRLRNSVLQFGYRVSGSVTNTSFVVSSCEVIHVHPLLDNDREINKHVLMAIVEQQ